MYTSNMYYFFTLMSLFETLLSLTAIDLMGSFLNLYLEVSYSFNDSYWRVLVLSKTTNMNWHNSVSSTRNVLFYIHFIYFEVTYISFKLYNPCLTGREVDLSPMNSFHTTALMAAMPLPHNLQLVFVWLLTALLYDAVDHGIFLISENDGFPSDTRQRDHFKHQNVRIRSNENKIKKNSDKLLTCWHNTSQMVYR